MKTTTTETPTKPRVQGLRSDAEDSVALSVVVLVTERPEFLPELYEEYAAPIRESRRSYEFVFALDPEFADTAVPLTPLIQRGEPIRVLHVAQSAGEASLLRLAQASCRGSIVLTLPAYYRIESSGIAALMRAVEDGAQLAAARRWPRRDALINRIQGRLLHALLGKVTQGRVHDVACGVVAMRREVLGGLPLYGDLLRYLPLIALREGYQVIEIPVPQHERDSAPRIYRVGTYLRRLLDVLALFFLLRFTQKPLRFFGFIGGLAGLAGTIILAVLAVQRLGGRGIADRPLLLLGVLLLVLGVQSVALGLVGEIIVYLHASRGVSYRLLDHSASEE